MEENRDIKIGDEVVLYFADSPNKTGKIEAMPTEGNELWYIRDFRGHLLMVNPYALNFTFMAKQYTDESLAQRKVG